MTIDSEALVIGSSRVPVCIVLWLLLLLSFAAGAQAQESAPIPPGQKAPLNGQYRPTPQLDPTRIVALVPMVDVPGIPNARAPLFLEERESPLKQASERTKTDLSKAQVPSGIVAFRAMVSDDGQWALIDLQARDAASLEHVRASQDLRVRIFSADALEAADAAKSMSLPRGLSLSEFLDQ